MKRYFIISLFIAASLFVIQGPLFAASWYVDGTLSSGANNGTSWTNAWRSFANVAWGSSGVKAGDTLYISGGSTTKTYKEQWSVKADGSPGKPITISIGQDSGHNGVAIFDYNASGDAGKDVGIGISRNYITLTGNVNGQRHIRVQNLRNTSKAVEAFGIGGSGARASNVIVEYVEVLNCNNGIYFTYPTAVDIRHNKVTARGDVGIGLIASDGTWDSNLVHGNEIELLVKNGGPDGIQCADAVSIYDNKFWVTTVAFDTSGQHTDMIQMTGNYLKVYNNEFLNIGDSAIDYDAWANPNTANVQIFNNVFRITEKIDPYPEFIRLYSSGTAIKSINNWKIINNTFVDNPDFPSIRMVFGSGNPTGNGNEIKNNIFYNCGSASYTPTVDISGSLFDFAANIYHHPANKSYICYSGSVYTAANWVSSKETSGKTAQPQFVRYTKNGVNNDFRLAANDTVAIDAGLNLSAYLKFDKSGVARPQGKGFDIGAYEYTSGSGLPAPPVVPPAPQNLHQVSTP